MKLKTCLSLLILSCAASANAEVTMPNLFTDNMVLQADTLVNLWGKATPGATVRAEGSWGGTASAAVGKDGNWKMQLPTPEGSYTLLTLTLTDSKDNKSLTFGNVLAGEVWIASGQSNMEMPLRGFWHQPVEGAGNEIMFSRTKGRGVRFVNVPKAGSYTPKDNFEGHWMVSDPSTAAEFSAVAWFFATSLRDILDVPVGIVSCAYGGSKVEGWEPAELIARYPDRNLEAERDNTDMNEYERVNVMYNAMLLPIAGYTARGFLWNQGESNVGGHDYYGSRQADMVGHWRTLWGNENMPFYYVELPGWEYGSPDGTECALFREAQQRAADPEAGMYIVCTSDLVYPDEVNDIHARNKRPIGERLAASASAHTYGVKGMPHTYPTFKEMDNRGNEAELYFNDAWNGLWPNENLEGFEVAGADKVFHPADARIDLSKLTVTVSSREVPDIKAVRYCFRNFAIGKVHDNMGMPLVPFRTDNWEK